MRGTLEDWEEGGLHYEIVITEIVPPHSDGTKYTATIVRPIRDNLSTGQSEPIKGANLQQHWGRTLDEAIAGAKTDLDPFRS